MFGTKNAFINLNKYFSYAFSYNNNNRRILPINTYYLMVFLDILFYLFLIIGFKIGNNISLRKCILISLIIQYASFAIIYFFVNNPFITMISMALFNIGSAICFLPSFKNCWKYFPNRNGFINGITLCATGISSSVLTYIGEFIIINPNHKEISINSINNIDINIINKFSFFLKINACMLIVCGFFGFLLSFEFKDEFTNNDLLESDKSDTGTGTGNDSSCSQEIISNYNLSKRPSLFETINLKNFQYNAIFSCKHLNLMIIAFLGLCKLNIQN